MDVAVIDYDRHQSQEEVVSDSNELHDKNRQSPDDTGTEGQRQAQAAGHLDRAGPGLHDSSDAGAGAEGLGPPDFSPGINDKEYIADLRKLRELRSFLIEQAVQLRAGESDTLSFGALNLLRYEQGGRSPSQEEWDALENLTGGLFRHLSDPLRRRFLSSRLPWWVPQFAVALGCIAMVAKIATGEEPEDYGRAPKDPASVALGRKGGNSEGGRHVGTQAKRDCEEGR